MSARQRVVVGSSYVILLAVSCIAVAVAVIFLYGAALTVDLAVRAIDQGVGPATTKALLLNVIELVDVFLVGTALYVIMIGLYELFIDPHLPSPSWLVIRSLDDLKAKVLVMVIVVLGVFFLGQVVAWDGARDLLPLGAAIALVIAALTFFLRTPASKPAETKPTPDV